MSYMDDEIGYKRVARDYPVCGLTDRGVGDVFMRLRGQGSAESQSGSGAPRGARKGDIESARCAMAGAKDAAREDASKATGLTRRTVHLIPEHGVELKPIRKIKAHRVQPREVPNWLEFRREWNAQSESDDPDVDKIFCADEKLLRIWGMSGEGGVNLAAYFRKAAKQSELRNDLTLRDDGTWQRSISAMAALGV